MLWLPMFLSKEFNYSNHVIANLQTSFDAGALIGGAALGWLSDRCYAKRSPVGAAAIVVSFGIAFTLTFTYKHAGYWHLAVCLFFLGMLLGGLHHLLCITCAADMGQQAALTNNKQATSTITGIIDGIGTLGTSVGQSVIAWSVHAFGWRYGYLGVISAAIGLTIIPMSSMLVRECREIKVLRKAKRTQEEEEMTEIK